MRKTRPLRSVTACSAVVALLTFGTTSATAEAVPALPGFTWSDDGEAIVAIEQSNGTSVALVRLVEGSTGRIRSEMRGESLSAELGGQAPAVRDLRVFASSKGDRVLFESAGTWILWTTDDGSLATLDELAGSVGKPRFSPDGRRLTWLREGDLWMLDLEQKKPVRLSRGSSAEAWFEWSPMGRTVALPARDANGRGKIWLVDVESAEQYEIDCEPFGEPLALRWRFDGGALAVLTQSTDGSTQTLALCHPEKLYCRPLARRPAITDRSLDEDFRFLSDGFLWSPVVGDGAIAFFDTLGRQRKVLVPEREGLLGISALFRATREVAVARAAPGGTVQLLLTRLPDGGSREIATGVGLPPTAISESQRTWVRPDKDAHGNLTGYLLERIDGTRIRAFAPSGAPSASTNGTGSEDAGDS